MFLSVSMWPWDSCVLTRVWRHRQPESAEICSSTAATLSAWQVVVANQWIKQCNLQDCRQNKINTNNCHRLLITAWLFFFLLKSEKHRHPALWNLSQLFVTYTQLWWGCLFCFICFSLALAASTKQSTRTDLPATADLDGMTPQMFPTFRLAEAELFVPAKT